MTPEYDSNNVFAKILRKEIPCDKVFENDNVLAFRDIHPKRKIHIVIIPKKPYCDLNDFVAGASETEIVALMRAPAEIAKELKFDAEGYRIISNCGYNGGQEVPHLHIHLLAGERIGELVGKPVS